MYVVSKKGIKIISAWRYPGRILEGEQLIILRDTLEWLEKVVWWRKCLIYDILLEWLVYFFNGFLGIF